MKRDFGWLLLLAILIFCYVVSGGPSPIEITHIELDKDSVYREYTEPTNQCEADALLRHNTINGTDSTWYHNGEIIYPDYVQQDTLVVIDAQFLNKEIILGNCQSDDDIFECLQNGCVLLSEYQEYIRTGKSCNH